MALPRKSDKSIGDLATEMVGIVLGSLFLLGVVELITKVRFWLFAAVPVACGLFIIAKEIRAVPSAFISSSADRLSVARRWRITRAIFVIALALSGCAIAMRGSVPFSAAAAVALLTYSHVQRKTWESEGTTETFFYHLAKASQEVLLIVSIGLIGYEIFCYRISRLPTDMSTLAQLREWEKKISDVHELAEHLHPSEGRTLILMLALYVARFIELHYFSTSRSMQTLGKIAKVSFKWLSRIALVTLVPASFTFLATTQTVAPFTSLESHVRNMKTEYQYLQGELAEKVAESVEWRLILNRWNVMSASERELLRQGAELRIQQMEILEKCRYALHRHDNPDMSLREQIKDSEKLHQSDTARMIEATASENISDTELWDANEHDIQRLAVKWEHDPKHDNAKNEMGDDLFDAVSEYVKKTISTYSGDHESIASAFLASYPLLKNFLDPVKDAMKETFLPGLKTKVAEISRYALNGSVNLTDLFVTEVSHNSTVAEEKIIPRTLASSELAMQEKQLEENTKLFHQSLRGQDVAEFEKEYKANAGGASWSRVEQYETEFDKLLAPVTGDRIIGDHSKRTEERRPVEIP